jgi:hypothetical protein
MPQQSQHQEVTNPAPSRQEFHNSNSSIGAITHLVKMAGILSPLVIGELVKDADKRWRYIRIASVLTAGLTETLWATRVRRSREEERHR